MANPANFGGRDSKTFTKGKKHQETLGQLTDILENLDLMLVCFECLPLKCCPFVDLNL